MAELAETMDQAVKTMADREGKYLTFTLANEDYGIGILKIKEIIGMMPITTVPQTPEFVKGVINLRGKVIPVLDLRLRFGMEFIDYTDRTCIIVVKIEGSPIVITVNDAIFRAVLRLNSDCFTVEIQVLIICACVSAVGNSNGIAIDCCIDSSLYGAIVPAGTHSNRIAKSVTCQT